MFKLRKDKQAAEIRVVCPQYLKQHSGVFSQAWRCRFAPSSTGEKSILSNVKVLERKKAELGAVRQRNMVLWKKFKMSFPKLAASKVVFSPRQHISQRNIFTIDPQAHSRVKNNDLIILLKNRKTLQIREKFICRLSHLCSRVEMSLRGFR